MFKIFTKALNHGLHVGLYEHNPRVFIDLIKPHVTVGHGRDSKIVELFELTEGIDVEENLELLEDEINTAIEANGGYRNTILKLKGLKEMENKKR